MNNFNPDIIHHCRVKVLNGKGDILEAIPFSDESLAWNFADLLLGNVASVILNFSDSMDRSEFRKILTVSQQVTNVV